MRVGQKGTALYMALLVIAIVSSLTVALLRMQNMEIRRTQMMVTSEQAYLYSQGIIAWAKGAIIKLKQNSQTQSKTKWPLILPPTALMGAEGKISGILQDAAGLININNLTTIRKMEPAQTQANAETASQNVQNQAGVTQQSVAEDTGNGEVETQLINLFAILGVQMSPEQQKTLLTAIKAWVSEKAKSTQILFDNFDNQYSKLNPPYRSPHLPMVGISELRTVAGMTDSAYNRILPFVVALPNNTTINTDAAPKEVLRASGKANNNSQPTTANTSLGTGSGSGYYLLRGDVFLEDQHFLVYSLLTLGIDITTNQPRVDILFISFGTL